MTARPSGAHPSSVRSPEARPPLATRGLTEVSEAVSVACPPDAFWAWFVAAPLPDLLPGGGGLPGVVGTEALNEWPWGRVGAARRVRLGDGTSVIEAVTEADPPRSLAYQVWGFAGVSALLVEQARGRFAFAEDGAGTRIVWSYAFAPRHAALRPLVALFARRRFAAFMRAGLAAMAARAPAPAS